MGERGGGAREEERRELLEGMILESRENGAISSSADRAGSSPLTSKLQQAWLYSQISKVQRRDVSSTSPVADVATEKRACKFPLPVDRFTSSPLASIKTSGVLNASQYETSYVHKSRPSSAGSLDFLRTSGGPQLVSYSKKMDKIPPLPSCSPTISSSDESCVTATTTTSTSAGSTSTDSSSNPSTSEGFTSCGALEDDLQDFVGATNAAEQVHDDEFDGSMDVLGQVEPYLNYIDGMLMDEDVEEERLLMEAGGAYLVLAKDLEALIEGEPRAPEIINDDGEEAEVPEEYDEDWTKGALGPDENDTENFIHTYTSQLSGHLADLSLALSSPRELDFSRWRGNEVDSRSDSEESGNLPNHSSDSNQCPAGEISTVSCDAVTDSATAELVDLLQRYVSLYFDFTYVCV